MAVSSGNNLAKRRLIIGGNVALAILIVWGLVVLVNFLANRTAPPASDWTRSGLFSFSSRSEKLLENLSEPIYLTALYRVGEMDEQGREQKRIVADLLQRYASLSNKVSYEVLDPLKDTAAKTRLIKRLIKKYAGEAEKHKNVIKKFKDSLAKDIVTLLEQERSTIRQLLENDPKIRSNQNVVAAFLRFNRVLNEAKIKLDEMEDLIGGGDIPRYSSATKMIKELYENVKTDLTQIGKYLSTEGPKIEGLDAQYRKSFAEAEARYKKVLDAVSEELKTCGDLPKLELEEIYDEVKRKDAKTILVESEKKAKVLTFSDVWPLSRARTGDSQKTEYDFNGEAAVSSAILGLTATEKYAVVFVHAGPPSPIKPGFAMMQMTQPPYQAVKEKLEEANLIVEDWDIRADDTPPEIKEAKRKIYVITPPPPQRRQGPMPQPGGYEQKHVEIIEKLMDQGERVMFLAKFSPMIMARPYPFAGLLKNKCGLKIETSKLVVRAMRIADQTIPNPDVRIGRYRDHEITTPIQSLFTTFRLAAPITLENKMPEGIKVTPLITITPKMGDYWGESNIFALQRNQAEKDEMDTAPPFHLAVAVENPKTGMKAVVFGNDTFATDSSVNAVQYRWVARGIVGILVNPGALDLFANSIFWLNDSENLIAVGPRRADVPRIAHISDTGVLAWKVFLWVIWPLAALGAGGAVYLVRRK